MAAFRHKLIQQEYSGSNSRTSSRINCHPVNSKIYNMTHTYVKIFSLKWVLPVTTSIEAAGSGFSIKLF